MLLQTDRVLNDMCVEGVLTGMDRAELIGCGVCWGSWNAASYELMLPLISRIFQLGDVGEQ